MQYILPKVLHFKFSQNQLSTHYSNVPREGTDPAFGIVIAETVSLTFVIII